MNTSNLKQKVESKFGRKVSSASEVHFLKQDIFLITKQNIGYNTLRRFFGFLPSTTPSRNTLNIISKYIGYENFSSFISDFKQDKEWYQWDFINNILLANEISSEDLKWLIKKRESDQYYKLITFLICSLVDKKNKVLLEIILKHEKLFDIQRNELAKVSTTVAKKLKQIYPKNKSWIISLLHFKTIRDLLLYSYVDIDSLNSYYGFLVKESTSIIIEKDEILFNKLILGFHQFISKANPQFIINDLVVPESCHPILLGRYYSILLIANERERDEIFLEILQKAKQVESVKELFQEIIPVLMILKKFKMLQKLFDDYYNELLDYDYWDHIHIQRYNLVALILTHISNERLDLVQSLFKYFDEDSNFHINDSYQKIFFNIAKYHFYNKIETNGKEAINSKDNYSKMVEKTGFKYFNKDFLISYFD